MAGIELMHAPYRGVSQAVNALFAGEIDLLFGSSIEVLPHAQQGRARLLGVTTAERVALVPDVPAIGEQVPGYAAPSFFSMWAPRGLPAPLRDRLVAELAAMREDAQLRERIAAASPTTTSAGRSAIPRSARAWRAASARGTAASSATTAC
jgi:tripartite-type tricarboxylate transporter receptor subunit TctC